MTGALIKRGDLHTTDKPCEGYTCRATRQEATRSWERGPHTPFLGIFGRSMEPLPPFGLQQWDNTFLFWPSFEWWEYSIYLLCVKKRPWCWEKLKAGGEGDDRGWDGWMASPTRWTWVWVPGMLQSMGLQRVGHDWASGLADRTYNCYMILLIKNN